MTSRLISIRRLLPAPLHSEAEPPIKQCQLLYARPKKKKNSYFLGQNLELVNSMFHIIVAKKPCVFRNRNGVFETGMKMPQSRSFVHNVPNIVLSSSHGRLFSSAKPPADEKSKPSIIRSDDESTPDEDIWRKKAQKLERQMEELLTEISTKHKTTKSKKETSKKNKEEEADEEGEEEEARIPDIIPSNVIFKHKYRPLKQKLVSRLKMWLLVRFGLFQKVVGVTIDEVEEGVKAAFQKIYPILGCKKDTLPSLEILSKFMEPPLLREFIARKTNETDRDEEIRLVEVQKVRVVDAIATTVTSKQPQQRQQLHQLYTHSVKKSSATLSRANAPRYAVITVVITTKEEVHAVRGVRQTSRTRFFQLDHLWHFKTALPTQEQIIKYGMNAFEEMPPRWRAGSMWSNYQLAIVEDDSDDQENDDDEEEEREDGKK